VAEAREGDRQRVGSLSLSLKSVGDGSWRCSCVIEFVCRLWDWRKEGRKEGRKERGRAGARTKIDPIVVCCPSMSCCSGEGGLLGSHGSRPQWRCFFALWRRRMGLAFISFFFSLFWILFVFASLGWSWISSVGFCGVREMSFGGFASYYLCEGAFLCESVVNCRCRVLLASVGFSFMCVFCAGVLLCSYGSSLLVCCRVGKWVLFDRRIYPGAWWCSVLPGWMMWATNDLREINVCTFRQTWVDARALVVTNSSIFQSTFDRLLFDSFINFRSLCELLVISICTPA
jgi:hypothetical protein